jgi:DNA adenine methylase
MTAFCAVGCSFSGKWNGGFARDGSGRNYASNAAGSINKKVSRLGGVQWQSGDYREVPLPPNSVVYCDPPYAGTTGYSGVEGGFNHIEFWEWCRTTTLRGHLVFVSEYSAPADFEAVWSIETKTDLHTREGKGARVEKLFFYQGALS